MRVLAVIFLQLCKALCQNLLRRGPPGRYEILSAAKQLFSIPGLVRLIECHVSCRLLNSQRVLPVMHTCAGRAKVVT